MRLVEHTFTCLERRGQGCNCPQFRESKGPDGTVTRAAIDPAEELVDVADRAVAGVKHDTGKIPLELLPTDALEEIAKVLQFGAKKYARRNWEKGISFSRLAGALMRHTFAWLRGEDKDPETGLSHMAHAGCEVLFILAFECRGRKDLDDRQG